MMFHRGTGALAPAVVVSPAAAGAFLAIGVCAGTSSIERDQHGKATWRNAPHSRPPQSRRPEAGGDQRGIPRRLGGAKTLARGTDTSAGQFRKLRRRAQGEPEAKMIGDAAACSPCGSGAGRRWSGPRPSGAIADVRISNRRSLPRMTSGAGGRRAVSALRADRPATFQH